MKPALVNVTCTCLFLTTCFKSHNSLEIKWGLCSIIWEFSTKMALERNQVFGCANVTIKYKDSFVVKLYWSHILLSLFVCLFLFLSLNEQITAEDDTYLFRNVLVRHVYLYDVFFFFIFDLRVALAHFSA